MVLCPFFMMFTPLAGDVMRTPPVEKISLLSDASALIDSTGIAGDPNRVGGDRCYLIPIIFFLSSLHYDLICVGHSVLDELDEVESGTHVGRQGVAVACERCVVGYDARCSNDVDSHV